MPKIETHINVNSEKYSSNYAFHKELGEKLDDQIKIIEKMGPAHRVEKHQNKGKLTA